MADYCADSAFWADMPMGLVRDTLAHERAALDAIRRNAHGESARALRGAMQRVMTAKLEIFRAGPALEEAVAELESLLVRSRSIGIARATDGANPELADAYRVQKMLRLALAVAYGALARTESRGAYCREDHPHRDDARWLTRTLARWARPGDTLPTLSYEEFDVSAMELPPGWRGYGTRDHIEHPDTEPRALEIASLRERCAESGRGAVQAAVMP